MVHVLEVICRLALIYESFKAFKAAPPPRKRRKANQDRQHEDASARSSHAEAVRRRRIKQMLRAWTVYAIGVRAEAFLDSLCGWWLPLYTTLRFAMIVFWLYSHKATSDVVFSRFLAPSLKPYEGSLDWLLALANDILDILCFPFQLLGSALLHGLSTTRAKVSSLWSRIRGIFTPRRRRVTEDGQLDDEQDAITPIDVESVEASDGVQETPRIARNRQGKTGKSRGRPRLSQMATPYVPGHLQVVASTASEGPAHPPIQPRVHPSERSYENITSFQEALDRAQAAFYEPDEDDQPAPRQRRAPVEDMTGVFGDTPSKRYRTRLVEVTLPVENLMPNGSSGKKVNVTAATASKRKASEDDKGEDTLAPIAKRIQRTAEATVSMSRISKNTVGQVNGHSRLPTRSGAPNTRQQKVTGRARRVDNAVEAQASLGSQPPAETDGNHVRIDKDRQLARETAAAARRLARERNANAPMMHQASTAMAAAPSQTVRARKKAA